MGNRRMLLWAIVAICTAAVVVWMVGVTGLILRQSQTNGAISADVRHQTEAIESCTTPGGECYERGADRTASAVADINRVAVAAAACADKPREQTVQEIQACVIERLANQAP